MFDKSSVRVISIRDCYYGYYGYELEEVPDTFISWANSPIHVFIHLFSNLISQQIIL